MGENNNNRNNMLETLQNRVSSIGRVITKLLEEGYTPNANKSTIMNWAAILIDAYENIELMSENQKVRLNVLYNEIVPYNMTREKNNETNGEGSVFVKYDVYIPEEWVVVYQHILAALADYGMEMLKDCKAGCKSRNKNALDCYNVFNAAVAAKMTGQSTLAKTLIEYVKAQMSLLYDENQMHKNVLLAVDEETKEGSYIVTKNEVIKLNATGDGFLYKEVISDGEPVTLEVDDNGYLVQTKNN